MGSACTAHPGPSREVADLAFALAELENICPDPGDGEKAGGPEAEETCAVPEVQKTRDMQIRIR